MERKNHRKWKKENVTEKETKRKEEFKTNLMITLEYELHV